MIKKLSDADKTTTFGLYLNTLYKELFRSIFEACSLKDLAQLLSMVNLSQSYHWQQVIKMK